MRPDFSFSLVFLSKREEARETGPPFAQKTPVREGASVATGQTVEAKRDTGPSNRPNGNASVKYVALASVPRPGRCIRFPCATSLLIWVEYGQRATFKSS